MTKVALIALGCEKNVINSEQMLYLLDQAGFQTVDDPADADVTVINTCGFIEAANREAVQTIEEVSETGSKIIAAGCCAEKLKTVFPPGTELRGNLLRLPIVAGYVGSGRFDDIVAAVNAVMDGQTPLYFGNLDAPVSETPRIHTGPQHTAYIKIAEGCDNRCAYCLIPSLRGPFRSRKQEAILDEARMLCQQGAKELVVIAQDTTRYGMDLYGEPRLAELLREMCAVPGLRRLRLHYLYPELITDELIETIAAHEQIVKYLDIPIQHSEDSVLSAMNRRYTREDLTRLIKKLRARMPEVILRTTVIVGFPGETQDEFNGLCDFLRETNIPRLGVFTYSREEGTAAASLPGQISETVKKSRLRVVERLQSRIIDAFNGQRKGTVTDVLCEGYDRAAGIYYGRSEAESPDIDGKVFFTSKKPVEAGEFVPVQITGVLDGDALGRVVLSSGDE